MGCEAPFDGDLGQTGLSIFEALKLAIKDKAPKLVPGANVNLTCVNTQCKDIPAHMATKAFADAGAIGVIGEVCSGATVAAAGVAAAAQLPLISPSATSPSLSVADTTFRTVPSDRAQGLAAANLAYSKGARRVAIVYEDTSYGYGLAFSFIAGFTKAGGLVEVVYSFPAGRGEPELAVQKVAAAKAKAKTDFVFLSTSNLTFAAAFARAAHADKLGLRIVSGDALAEPAFAAMLRDNPAVIADLAATSPWPGKPAFVEQFKAATDGAYFSAFTARAYDAMTALLRAYRDAAPPRAGRDIVAQLHKQRFDGASGPVEFDAFGDRVPGPKSFVVVRHNATTGRPDVKGFI